MDRAVMKTLAFVLAGGRGARLFPLTANEAKPALDFACGTRIIDFVLSNLVNSGIDCIYVLAQYKPETLVEHVRSNWEPVVRRSGGTIRVELPDPNAAHGAFLGTADAVYKTQHLWLPHAPDLVAVFAADHVYRMDVRQMLEAHVLNKADVTVATLPLPLERVSEFGVVKVEADGRIRAFEEKSSHPWSIPGRPSHACASLGNYLFNPVVLAALLDSAARRGETDFGRHMLPRATATHRVFAYDFAGNRVAGTLPDEEPHYWRDVGTIEAYRAAQRDALGPAQKFSLENEFWPISGSERVDGVAAAKGQR